MPPDPHHRQWLLDLARAAIAAHVANGADSHRDAQRVFPNALSAWRTDQRRASDRSHSGVFVSLHRQGRLRGCIGTLDATVALEDAVGEAAVGACSADPRFPPLCAAELPDVEIQISILGVIERVTDIESIHVGRHGLIVEARHRRGLLLPQVAIECGWTREQFLGHTCEKAGLHWNAWKSGAIVSRFEAEIVGPSSTR